MREEEGGIYQEGLGVGWGRVERIGIREGENSKGEYGGSQGESEN